MPSLGADMDAGTLQEWRVAPGDRVRRGDIVAVVKTDKADVEVEVFEDGLIGDLLVTEGTEVPVGTALATVVGEGEAPPADTAGPPEPAPESTVSEPPPSPPLSPAPPAAPEPTRDTEPTPAEPSPSRRRISPRARRLAAERGVEIDELAERAEGGVVTGDDVEGRAGPSATPPAAVTAEGDAAEAAVAMRRAIARAMSRSKREIPHYYLEQSVDCSAALEWLAEENASRRASERILTGALLCAATARAVAEVPGFSGFYRDDRFEPAETVHLGVAIALRTGGLVAPAIHGAAELSVAELMPKLRDLTARARAGTLRSSEMSDPTVTLTSLGERGVELVQGVIFPPQVALVGFGSVTDRPWAVHGNVEVRPIVHVTLAADHRVTDGHLGARLLTRIDEHLQEPEAL